MPDEKIASLRAVAEEAARRAGKVLAERFTSARTIEFKGGIDLVTDADKAAEAVLLSYLRGEDPHHAILAEESGASAGEGLRWIVDPLDGTTNYAHGVPHFSVSVGVDGPEGLMAGAVFDPLRNELYSAGRGLGATLNGVPLRTSAATRLDRALFAFGFPYDVHEMPEGPVALVSHFVRRARGMRRFGSAALDLAYVAAGRYDGYFEFGLKPWDVAAGALLVLEAGGAVEHLDGAPLDVQRADVVASAPGLTALMRAECRAVLASLPPEARRIPHPLNG